MMSSNLRFISIHPLKQFLTGRKRGEDRNTKIWISQEQKELFWWNGCSFPLIPRSKQRSKRCRNNVNFWNFKSMESTFNCIHNYKTDDIKNPFYHIHIHLNNIRKKYPWKIASEILLNGPFTRTDLIKFIIKTYNYQRFKKN